MLERVITGGQTGADQAGWRAAKRCGIETGGYMPRRFLAEDGRHPEFAELYGAQETYSDAYSERTRKNAQGADATLWFGDPASRGAKLTFANCLGPWVVIKPDDIRYNWDWGKIAAWLADPRNAFRVLNVAGNRESKNPGIGEFTEAYLMNVFAAVRLAESRSLPAAGFAVHDQDGELD